MLSLKNIEVIYSGVILILKGVSLEVPDGQIVAFLGANGAGKTTTLKAISGLLHTELGEVTDGSIEFNGDRIDRENPEDIVRMGIVQVLEGRPSFEQLTIEENLMVGAYSRKDRDGIKRDLEMVYRYFPPLGKLRHRVSGYLSGGERQMQVIGRGLMARPKLVLLDEPSLGLSPIFVRTMFELIQTLNNQRVTILLVEQNIHQALKIAHQAYVLKTGRIAMSGRGEELLSNPEVQKAYIGERWGKPR